MVGGSNQVSLRSGHGAVDHVRADRLEVAALASGLSPGFAGRQDVVPAVAISKSLDPILRCCRGPSCTVLDGCTHAIPTQLRVSFYEPLLCSGSHPWLSIPWGVCHYRKGNWDCPDHRGGQCNRSRLVKICTTCHCRSEGKSWHCQQCSNMPVFRSSFVSFDNGGLEDKTYAGKESAGDLACCEKRNAWFTSRVQLLCWALQRFFPQVSNLFEGGCSTGFVLQVNKTRLPTLKLTGEELSLASLDHAHSRVPDAKLLHTWAEAIPVARSLGGSS